jgi:enoyl-CoA hydratase/carnithine racemase
MSLVIVEKSDGVATLTLNNPTERNTLTAPMVADILAAMDDVENDSAIGAIVVTGAAPAFCAGALPPQHQKACRTFMKAFCALRAAHCPPLQRSMVQQ